MKHDADCHFFSWKICTCGLLHQLHVNGNPLAEYALYYEDCSYQLEALDLLASAQGHELRKKKFQESLSKFLSDKRVP